MDIIETKNLSKTYGKFHALNDVNLQVPSGSIYGFIGLNGAGKTTTMRILLNMIRKSEGEIRIMGEDINRVSPDFWNHIGYLIETPQSYGNLTTFQNLNLYGKLREIPKAIRLERIEYYMNELELTAYRDKRVRNLSLGNRQKIGIVKALIHDPQILLLDEPTNGLDPHGLNQVRLLLQKLAVERGTTIFISSHILAEMEQMLTYIGVLSHGKLIQQESYAEFRKHAPQNMIANFTEKRLAEQAKDLLKSQKITSKVDGNSIIISRSEQQHLAIQNMVHHNLIPSSWYEKSDGLEEYFLDLLAKEGHK